MRDIAGWVGLVVLGSGCGGGAVGDGELGRLTYAISTDYELDSLALSDAVFTTNHRHALSVSLTEAGLKAAGDGADRIVHSSPEAEVADDDNFRSLSFVAADAGPVVLESWLDDVLFDKVQVRVDRPVALDVLVWVRGPWDAEATRVDGTGPLVVEEGSQVSFLAIPVSADARRLISGFTPDITVDPLTIAVPDQQVFHVYEQGVTTIGEPVSFYVIEPGTATFTVSDPANGVSRTQMLEVRPISEG